ncbi:MAG: enoyl-CoA hydratase-related protein [Actinobacteria bacterium]|nr:enoyl-CoA hydratase-related protein [Actinomycetota bacterium]
MTSTEQFVTVEHRPDGVALVTLKRPKMNALSIELLEELAGHAEEMAAQPPGAVVLWGGERIFAAGADIKELSGSEHAEQVSLRFQRATTALESIPRAVVAAVCGYALGGGCELALACDLRVAGENARFGQPEVLLGVIPGGGGTQRLTSLVGPARAKDLVLTGRQVGAAEAFAIGLVDRVVPDAQVLDEALDLASELAAGAVVAQGLAKRAISFAGSGAGLEAGLEKERALFAEAFKTEDAAIGIRSFKENGPGKARFTGR